MTTDGSLDGRTNVRTRTQSDYRTFFVQCNSFINASTISLHAYGKGLPIS